MNILWIWLFVMFSAVWAWVPVLSLILCWNSKKDGNVCIQLLSGIFTGVWAFHIDRDPSDASGRERDRPRLHICHKVWTLDKIIEHFVSLQFFSLIHISFCPQKTPTDDNIWRRKSTDPGKNIWRSIFGKILGEVYRNLYLMRGKFCLKL